MRAQVDSTGGCARFCVEALLWPSHPSGLPSASAVATSERVSYCTLWSVDFSSLSIEEPLKISRQGSDESRFAFGRL